ncbi:MAG TPA: DUF427 domain-containing protein [Gaiellaceae bacterium]|nr:DUF427 domain-containing protein [Gaiellaceae bacterium]
MGLTNGTGPLGPRPKGTLNFQPPQRVVYVEPWPRRVRAILEDETVVDSERTVLMYESGALPRYAFPRSDVTIDAEPEPAVDGYVRVPWSAADRWLEEDEEVIVHPHDPYHRIEVLRSSRLVQVRVRGELVASSTRPRILFETGLQPRYYLPPEDVRTDVLEPLDIRTGCAYKGWATYWDAITSAGRVPAVAWSYPEPLREGEPIRDLLCFFQERPEIEVTTDGSPVETHSTIYARTAWLGAEWVLRARDPVT